LIKITIVHHLRLSGDSWEVFLLRSGFATLECGQVDKTIVTKTLVGPIVPPSTLLPVVEPSTYPNADLPNTLPNPCSKDNANTIKRRARKKGKGNTNFNRKGKKAARWVSRCAHNKPKQNTDQKPIVLSEDSDSKIEQFFTKEYPYSHGLCSIEPYDYVSNLAPCLKDDPNFPRIKFDSGTPGNLKDASPVMPRPDRSQCDECNSWLQRYYIDVPLLQSQIKSLEHQVTMLSKENDRLQANDKRQNTTGSIVFKNVEATTAIVNSKLS
jgi:hypothetical protein